MGWAKKCRVTDRDKATTQGVTKYPATERGISMITKEIAQRLHTGQVLYHKGLTNKDGSPVRARVNGVVKFWKRSPERFQIPMKYGLKECFYITNSENADNWRITEHEEKKHV